MWLRLTPVFGVVMAMTFILGSLMNHPPIYLEAAGGAPYISGLAFAVFSLVAAVVMVSSAYGAVDYISKKLAVSSALILLAAGSLILGVSNVSLVPTFGAMGASGLGFGLLFPSMAAMISETVPNRCKGIAFGIFYAIYSLGVVLGAAASGFAADMWASLGAPFFLSEAVAIFSLLAAMYVRAAHQNQLTRLGMV